MPYHLSSCSFSAYFWGDHLPKKANTSSFQIGLRLIVLKGNNNMTSYVIELAVMTSFHVPRRSLLQQLRQPAAG